MRGVSQEGGGVLVKPLKTHCHTHHHQSAPIRCSFDDKINAVSNRPLLKPIAFEIPLDKDILIFSGIGSSKTRLSSKVSLPNIRGASNHHNNNNNNITSNNNYNTSNDSNSLQRENNKVGEYLDKLLDGVKGEIDRERVCVCDTLLFMIIFFFKTTHFLFPPRSLPLPLLLAQCPEVDESSSLKIFRHIMPLEVNLLLRSNTLIKDWLRVGLQFLQVPLLPPPQQQL